MTFKIIRASSWMQAKQERLFGRYIQQVRAIGEAGLHRRQLLKMGLMTGTVGALYRAGLISKAQAANGSLNERLPFTSPPNTPFKDPLPMLPMATAMTDGTEPCYDAPVANPISLGGENRSEHTGCVDARVETHQRWQNFNPHTHYEVIAREVDHNFYWSGDGVRPAKIWSYIDAATGMAGPLQFQARYGQPVCLRVHNLLPNDNRGFGINQTSLHLHNAHNACESDGGPLRFTDPGQFYDYLYPNVRAGFASTHPTSVYNGRTVPGDALETQSTLWMHDHRFDFTAQNTYKGLVAGFYKLFSDDINLDTGDETTGLRLPSGKFDVPLLFTDKLFDPTTGELFYDLTNFDGHIGDKHVVNGKIQPYFEVKRRKYRFRLLVGGPSRFYEFYLSNGRPFTVISNDGNLLPRPLSMTNVRLGVAERKDVIIDFSKAKIGDKIYLQNRLEQRDGKGTTGKVLSPTNIIEFRVVADAVGEDADNSVIPTTLLPLPSRNIPVTQTRTFEFGASSGSWTINGKIFDPERIDVRPRLNSAEIWTLKSGGGWSHPLHIHHEEFQILQRDGKPLPSTSDEIARKDVVRIGQGAYGSNTGSETKVLLQFRDWEGDYPMHCHNTVHEDHAMMLRYKIER